LNWPARRIRAFCFAARRGAGKSYSIDTIERVKAANADTNGLLFFIIGSDALAEIQTRRRWEDVIRAVEFIRGAAGHDCRSARARAPLEVWNCRSPLPTFATHWHGESRLRSCRP
jgi:nicotinic acid mononucleotide adenylyltransferase